MLGSCDALDQDPSTAVTVDTAITSVDDLANAVNGAYYVATYGTTLTVASEMAIYADLAGPDSYQPASSGQNASCMAQFSLTANDTYNAYYYLYAAIASVNNALEKAALLEDQDAVAPYVAELYAMRGLFHFHLATYFAPIPTSGNPNRMGIVLADKVFDVNYIGERASLEDTYDFIINDFTKAVDSGLKFYDHMLWQIPHHAGIRLDLVCRGDLEVDEHHSMEDVAIALGEALTLALGDKRGIERYGFVLPMDESRAMVLIDLGGRADFDWDVPFTREYVGDAPTEMYRHFFHTLCVAMKCNLHIQARGENNHHLIEGVFKAFARALRMAVRRDPFSYSLPSSKGIL